MRSSCHGTAETNPTRNHEVVGSTPGLAQWVKDLALLWLWCRSAAVAPTGPLAWEPPYAVGVSLRSKKKKKEIAETKRNLSLSYRLVSQTQYTRVLKISSKQEFPSWLSESN